MSKLPFGKLALLSAAFLMLGIPTGSIAATIVQSRSIPIAETNWNQSVTFDKFDQTEGELISLKITVTTWISMSVVVYNSSNAYVSGTVSSHVLGLLQDDLGYFGSTPQIEFYVPEPPATYLLAPYSHGNFGSHERTVDSVLNSEDAAILNEFSSMESGAGIMLNYALSTYISNDGFGDFIIDNVAGATLTLEYSYTPVPEPSTLSMVFGACLCALLPRFFQLRRSQVRSLF